MTPKTSSVKLTAKRVPIIEQIKPAIAKPLEPEFSAIIDKTIPATPSITSTTGMGRNMAKIPNTSDSTANVVFGVFCGSGGGAGGYG